MVEELVGGEGEDALVKVTLAVSLGEAAYENGDLLLAFLGFHRSPPLHKDGRPHQRDAQGRLARVVVVVIGVVIWLRRRGGGQRRGGGCDGCSGRGGGGIRGGRSGGGRGFGRFRRGEVALLDEIGWFHWKGLT